MGVFCEFDDVEVRFEGKIPASKSDYIEEKITDAESLLTSLVPTVKGTTDPGRLQRAKAMVADAVLRVYRNPAGVAQETMGPFGATSRASAASSGLLYFPPEELNALRGSVRRAKVGTITTAPWRPYVPRQW